MKPEDVQLGMRVTAYMFGVQAFEVGTVVGDNPDGAIGVRLEKHLLQPQRWPIVFVEASSLVPL